MSFGPFTSEVTAIESDAEDVVKDSIEDSTTGKVIADRDFNSQSYTPNEVWLTIFQVGDVTNSFLAVSQTQENKVMESLGRSKYQYGVELMTVASSASRKLGSVDDDSMLKQRGKDCFIKSDC